MTMSAEERKLREVKSRLAAKYAETKNGDMLVQQEFETYINMWRANIPLKYWDREISDVQDPKVAQALRSYSGKLNRAILEGTGLYLFGTQGTGKTLAACLSLKEALRQGYTAYFTMLTEVLEKYCDGRYDKEARTTFSHNILEADFLVVDDIDKGYISDKSTFIDTAYDYVFRTRANKNLPVIITSNMRREDFGDQEKLTFGKSLVSIFDEHLIDILVQGKDRRKERQEKLRSFLDE